MVNLARKEMKHMRGNNGEKMLRLNGIYFKMARSSQDSQ